MKLKDTHLAQSDIALSLKEISISFGSLTAVKNVSADFYYGEVVGLIGENGAGKSSLLKILAGIYKQDKGSIEMGGKKLNFRGPRDAFKSGIGVVHQEQSLFSNLSVAENLDVELIGGGSFLRLFKAYNWRAVNRSAVEVLERLNSTINPAAKVGTLSFIDRQMVEIARVLQVGKSNNTRPLIVLDEPTSLLQPHETVILEREISRIKEFGCVVFVSHRLSEVVRICDRILVMREGELVAIRSKEEFDQKELFQLMVGKEWRSQPRVYTESSKEPVLEVEGLSQVGKFKDINLSLHEGEILAIVGASSSGREDLMKAIFGASKVDSGSITIKGKQVERWSIPKAIETGLGMISSERKTEGMVGGLSAAQNLSMIFAERFKFFPLVNSRKENGVAHDWFERLDVRPRQVKKDLESFSGGNQQKVVLAKWLKSKSLSLLLLDHPLRGLDPGAAATVNTLIRSTVDQGTSVLLLSDTLEEALEMADRIIVMRDGEISGLYDLHVDQPSTLDLLEKMV
jgi:ribose transport system ATP-binding protein